MAKFAMSGEVKLSADKLLQLLVDPAEHEKKAKSLGATVATCKKSEPAPGKVLLELYVEEPSKKGGEDKFSVTYEWNLTDKTCKWSRKDHVYGDIAKVGGVIRLSAAGSGCKMTDEGEINIGIPILGSGMAKKIAAALERKFPDNLKYWETRT